MNNEEYNLTDVQLLRIKAEEHLKENQKKDDKPAIKTDVKKLLHELQVHQIELEMQNEELRHANETTEAALKKYTMLYDFSPMGYFTLDSDCRICDLNFTGAELLHDRRFALENSNFRLFISEDSLPVFNSFFKKIFSGNSKESCQVKLGYNSHPLTLVYIEGIVIDYDRKCLLSVLDITGFKKIE